MTLREMIIRFQDSVDDRTFWNDVRAIALCNRFKDKMAQEMRIVAESYYEFDSVQGQQNYQVPSKLVTHHYLYYNSSYNTEIKIVKSPRNIYGPYAEVTQEGWPTIGYIWGASGRRQLTIYPLFNTDGITVQWWFWGWPEDLAVDNDEPQFPVGWHPSLVEGMINQAKVDDKEMSPADALILWKDQIRIIKALDVTRDLVARKGQMGTIESHFPRIGGSGDPDDWPFRIVGADEGSIW